MRHGNARSKAEDSPSYYEWRPQGQPFSVQISFAVIDQLEADVMKGFWSVPKRGAEVGGVLFGRVAAAEGETVVYVEDYEPVECEYRRGPSFVLSDSDRRRLERTLRKGTADRQVVGMYRSHTRLGLYLDQDDQSLIENYFPGSNQVFLLVRPHASKTSVGGFFFWEEGNIHRQSTYLEFPFSRAEILKRAEGVKTAEDAEPAAAHAPAQPSMAPPLPAPEPPARREIRVPAVLDRLRSIRLPDWAGAVKWRPVGVAALTLLALAALEYQVVRFFSHRTPAAAAAEADYAPALRIERNGDFLQVNWNRNAPSILHARRAVLEITDGGSSKELRLDPGQLRNGSVAYSPTSGDVNFRLELVGAKTTVTESLRVVEGAARRPGQARTQAPPAALKRPSPAVAVKPAVEAGRPPRGAQATAKSASRTRHRPVWYDDGL
ncbi:MAG: hypothetical protein ACM336_13430 [Acidobacteriota bacterium]